MPTIAELKQRQDARETRAAEKNARLGESIEIAGDTGTISLPRTRIHTLDELVAYCKIDLTVWEVERFIANKWEMGAKDKATDKITVEPLYQIKAFLKRKRAVADAAAEIAALKEKATRALRIKWPSRPRPEPTGNLLEIVLADHHFGKLAWGRETGGPNYDTKIAVETYWRAFDALLARTAHLQFERILFIIGNDLLNSDDTEGRTTAGTYVSTDVRYQKTFEVVRNLKIEAIQRLRQIAPVDVLMTRGNHDSLSTWHLGDSLEMFFHGAPDVTVNNQPRERKYYQWGKGLILSTHGDKGKLSDYPLVMAREAPEMWAATRFREAHTGHKHKKFVDEFHGVRVRILSALCPADAWHAAHAFVGNLRASEAFVWNKDQGIIATAEYTDYLEGD